MNLPPPILYSPSHHAHHLPTLAQIHADCVLHDHTLLTFLPTPDGAMPMDKLLAYWRDRVEEIEDGSRAIVLQLATPTSEDISAGRGGTVGLEEVVGYVSLAMPFAETGPFRALVEKLLVSPRWRRMGIAKRVMSRLEDLAREKDRGLLMLDTEVGSEAEKVYPRLGWTRLGVVPKYGISPKDGRLTDEVWFYKDLRDHKSVS